MRKKTKISISLQKEGNGTELAAQSGYSAREAAPKSGLLYATLLKTVKKGKE